MFEKYLLDSLTIAIYTIVQWLIMKLPSYHRKQINYYKNFHGIKTKLIINR